MLDRLGTIILLVVWIGQMGSVAPMAGAGGGGSRPALSEAEGCMAWVQVEDWRARIAYQVQRLALRQRCGGRRGRRRRIRRIRQRRRRQRQAIAVWRRLKPVLEELVKEETVRETNVLVETKAQAGRISDFRLPIQVVVVTPDYSQTKCPDCGGATKYKHSYYSHPQDIDLERPTVLQVYREVRECCDESCEWSAAPELDFDLPPKKWTRR